MERCCVATMVSQTIFVSIYTFLFSLQSTYNSVQLLKSTNKRNDMFSEADIRHILVEGGSRNIDKKHHSHKKRKDSLETRAVLLTFSLEREISGVAVQSIHQNSEKWWLL